MRQTVAPQHGTWIIEACSAQALRVTNGGAKLALYAGQVVAKQVSLVHAIVTVTLTGLYTLIHSLYNNVGVHDSSY